MRFINANNIWWEPTTQLFSLFCRRVISSEPASHISFPSLHHRFWRKYRCLYRITLGSNNLWSLLRWKLIHPPQMHQHSIVFATHSRFAFARATSVKAPGGKRGPASLGLWFPFVGKHDGSEQCCWNSAHLPRTTISDRQTCMQEGSCVSIWPGEAWAAKSNLRRGSQRQIKLSKGNLTISASTQA